MAEEVLEVGVLEAGVLVVGRVLSKVMRLRGSRDSAGVVRECRRRRRW